MDGFVQRVLGVPVGQIHTSSESKLGLSVPSQRNELTDDEMRRRARLVIWLTLAGAIGIVGYFAFFFFWIFLTATCSNDTVGQFPSPHNENHVAVVIEQNCGATTDFATSVAIIYAGSAVDRDKDYFFSVKGRNKIEVVWDEYGNFTVVYDRPSRIHRQAIIWQTMPIRYRERETPTKREE